MLKQSCHHVFGQLMDFVEAALPEEVTAQIRDHIAECKACTRIIETLQQTQDLCHRTFRGELPEGAGDKLLLALRQKLGCDAGQTPRRDKRP